MSFLRHLSWRERFGDLRVACSKAPARSSLTRVLTLCVQGLGVSENAAHQPRGHCPVESVQEMRSCPVPHHREPRRPVYTPGGSSGQVESWRGLRGWVPRPRGQTWWGACVEGAPMRVLGPPCPGEAGQVPLCPLQASAFPDDKSAGNTDWERPGALEQCTSSEIRATRLQAQIHSLTRLLSTKGVRHWPRH